MLHVPFSKGNATALVLVLSFYDFSMRVHYKSNKIQVVYSSFDLYYFREDLVSAMRSYFGGLLCVCWSPDGR